MIYRATKGAVIARGIAQKSYAGGRIGSESLRISPLPLSHCLRPFSADVHFQRGSV
jgi:hypothetical protein